MNHYIGTDMLRKRMDARSVSPEALAKATGKTVRSVQRNLAEMVIKADLLKAKRRGVNASEDDAEVPRTSPLAALQPVASLLGFDGPMDMLTTLKVEKPPKRKTQEAITHPHAGITKEILSLWRAGRGIRQLCATFGYAQEQLWAHVRQQLPKGMLIEQHVDRPFDEVWKSVCRKVPGAGSLSGEPQSFDTFCQLLKQTTRDSGEPPLLVFRNLDQWLRSRLGDPGDGGNSSDEPAIVKELGALRSNLDELGMLYPVVLDVKIGLMTFIERISVLGSWYFMDFGALLCDDFDRWIREEVKRRKKLTEDEVDEIRAFAGRHPESWLQALDTYTRVKDPAERMAQLARITRAFPAQIMDSLPTNGLREVLKNGVYDSEAIVRELVIAGILYHDGSEYKPVAASWERTWKDSA